MKEKNRKLVWIIFGIYLAATCALLIFGYGTQRPAVQRQEFPFTLTYSWQGKTETISDIYVAEYDLAPQYMGDAPVNWFGYIKDRDVLQADYYHIAESDTRNFSIDLNMEPGYFMGDPRYQDAQCQPTTTLVSNDGGEDIRITDGEMLKQMGFYIVSWEYPEPIENSFFFGGFSMSSQATFLTTILAIAALLACVILIRREPEVVCGLLDKISVVLNFMMAILVLPFIFAVSTVSEILGDTSFMQQLLYITPAVTAVGIAGSVTLRRMGRKRISFWIQFAGLALFALVLLADAI